MSKSDLRRFAGILFFLATTTAPAWAQEAAVPAAPATIWNFLGIPQGYNAVHANLFNRRGNLPGLEKKPPLKNIADAANLKSDVPAIKAAAEIKQAEDLKAQKVKAIKYLATIGCGCYDKDEKVTKALLAAMDDCTEEVRYQAVMAVMEAGCSDYCVQCKQKSCCNQKIVEQLAKIAGERDDEGCFVEPSERVRAAAGQAMQVCCAGQGPPPAEPTPEIESAPEPRRIEGQPEPATPEVPKPATPNATAASPSDRAASVGTPPGSSSSRRRYQLAASAVTTPASLADYSNDAAPRPPEALPPVHKKVQGSIASVNLSAGIAELHLHDGESLPPGTSVNVFHEFLMGRTSTAVLQVIDSRPGAATARLLYRDRSPKIARGDQIVAWK